MSAVQVQTLPFPSQQIGPVEETVALIKGDEGLLNPLHDASLPIESDLTKIQASPYSEEPHLLQLNSLATPYSQLAIALRSFTPTHKEDYAEIPYTEVFNFDQVLEVLRKVNPDYPGVEGVYIVAFKSILWPDTRKSAERRQILADVDKDSHVEATESGGLLKYWYGTPNVHGRNLATCWWRNRHDAKVGGGGKAHRQGMRMVRGWYEEWRIEEYSFNVAPGATSYTIEPYQAPKIINPSEF